MVNSSQDPSVIDTILFSELLLYFYIDRNVLIQTAGILSKKKKRF